MPTGPAATSFSPGTDYKLGAMKKKCGGMKKWALRYLILDKPNKILYYYHTPKDPSPRRALDLMTCTISRLTPDESPKEPGFKITQPSVRDFVFVGNNAAIVDDWMNALFQAKSPSVGGSMPNGGMIDGPGGMRPVMSPRPLSAMGSPNSTGTPDNFSYNGPTLAVIPNRASGLSNSPPPDSLASNVPPPRPAAAASARSTQSTVSDSQSTNNTTLVGAGPGDTNSTLVAGGEAPKQSGQPVPQLVPVIILTSDNKKIQPIERPVLGIISIGRYVGNQPQNDNSITFKSKVISRHHAEIWTVNGEVYVRDSRSQSGTFLNAMRLSEPSRESKPYRLKPGDVLQFGVDYKGATEDNARCISLRVDIKHKMMEVGGMKSLSTMRGAGGEKEDTLVGANGGSEEGTTVVGGRTKSADRTLVGAGPPHNQPPMPMPGQMQNMQGGPMMQPGMGMRPPMVVGRPQLMQAGPPQMINAGQPQMMGGPQMMRPPMAPMGMRPGPGPMGPR